MTYTLIQDEDPVIPVLSSPRIAPGELAELTILGDPSPSCKPKVMM